LARTQALASILTRLNLCCLGCRQWRANIWRFLLLFWTALILKRCFQRLQIAALHPSLSSQSLEKASLGSRSSQELLFVLLVAALWLPATNFINLIKATIVGLFIVSSTLTALG
jgi:hypothetical protein